MSTTTVIMEADADELITDMFKSVYGILSHPDVSKVIIIHDRLVYRVKRGKTMERKDMIKKIEAGESPVNICLEKYREVQCKIINDEPVGMEHIGAQTCALCFVFDEKTCCDKCPLKLANHPCKGGNTSWGKLYDLVAEQEYSEEVSKEELLKAIDAMISDLKDAKEYEDESKSKEPEQTYRIGQKFKHNDESYILAQIGIRRVTFINLKDGNRWTEGENVQECYHITEEELNSIINNRNENYVFELIEVEE